MSDGGQTPEEEIRAALSHGYGPQIARFALACLGGIPFAGGFLAEQPGLGQRQSKVITTKFFRVG